MQTFLPHANFLDSAMILDKKRQMKQVLEAYQILNVFQQEKIFTINKTRIGWQNHPAVHMWRGYQDALISYYNIMWDIAVSKWNIKFKKLHKIGILSSNIVYPPWLGNEIFHSSHRSNLLRKDAAYYSQFNWTEPPTLPYFWPSKQGY